LLNLYPLIHVDQVNQVKSIEGAIFSPPHNLLL